ncbi:MAG: hypothetical protein VB137_08150 [Burkholderia sp.]
MARMTIDRPNEMWGADGAKVQTVDEGLVWIFAAVDHCDAACVGIYVTKVGNRFAALEPISQKECTSSSDRSKLTPAADCPCEWITARSTRRTTSAPSSSSGGLRRATPSLLSRRPTALPSVSIGPSRSRLSTASSPPSKPVRPLLPLAA